MSHASRRYGLSVRERDSEVPGARAVFARRILLGRDDRPRNGAAASERGRVSSPGGAIRHNELVQGPYPLPMGQGTPPGLAIDLPWAELSALEVQREDHFPSRKAEKPARADPSLAGHLAGKVDAGAATEQVADLDPRGSLGN